MKSGGMFRLVKINSDNERAISELLGVTGLPTVFAVNAGSFSDKFVGMLPQDQLQNFLVRCVTGFGERVQSEVTESELVETTEKANQFAGLASLSFKNRGAFSHTYSISNTHSEVTSLSMKYFREDSGYGLRCSRFGRGIDRRVFPDGSLENHTFIHNEGEAKHQERQVSCNQEISEELL